MSRSFLFTVLLAVAVVTGACAPTATPTAVPPTRMAPTAVPPTAAAPTAVATEAVPAGPQLPEIDPAAVKGDIITAGSSTVFPLSERIAERFRDEGYTGNITIDSIGSGAGFERFCKTGETDIANADRKSVV